MTKAYLNCSITTVQILRRKITESSPRTMFIFPLYLEFGLKFRNIGVVIIIRKNLACIMKNNR